VQVANLPRSASRIRTSMAASFSGIRGNWLPSPRRPWFGVLQLSPSSSSGASGSGCAKRREFSSTRSRGAPYSRRKSGKSLTYRALLLSAVFRIFGHDPPQVHRLLLRRHLRNRSTPSGCGCVVDRSGQQLVWQCFARVGGQRFSDQRVLSMAAVEQQESDIVSSLRPMLFGCLRRQVYGWPPQISTSRLLIEAARPGTALALQKA